MKIIVVSQNLNLAVIIENFVASQREVNFEPTLLQFSNENEAKFLGIETALDVLATREKFTASGKEIFDKLDIVNQVAIASIITGNNNSFVDVETDTEDLLQSFGSRETDTSVQTSTEVQTSTKVQTSTEVQTSEEVQTSTEVQTSEEVQTLDKEDKEATVQTKKVQTNTKKKLR